MVTRNTKSFSLLKGRRLRVTRVDNCGRVVYGDDSTIVNKGFVSVGLTTNTTESDAISVTNANGDICVSESGVVSLAGYGVEIAFCNVDPELLALITGQEVYLDAQGDPIGFTQNTKIQLDGGFALEVWAGAAGTDVCADPNAQGSYGYILLPSLQGGVLSDFVVENAALTFTMTGANTKDGHRWGSGPYNVMLNSLGTAAPLIKPLDANDALLLIGVSVAPPEATVGSRPLLDPAAPAVTAVAGTTTPASLTVAFAVTPDDQTTPVWYDFGDETWDYVPAAEMGETSHTYAEAGTYTVKASTNGTWVSTTVTVPGA